MITSALSVFLQLIIQEQLSPLVKKLDAIADDNKVIHKKLTKIEQQNADLKAHCKNLIADIKTTLNTLEQAVRKHNVVITGIQETYAERVTDRIDGNSDPATSRDDTIRIVCSLLNKACKLTLCPSDIQFATWQKSKRASPCPLGFYSTSLRSSVITACQWDTHCPSLTLQFIITTI